MPTDININLIHCKLRIKSIFTLFLKLVIIKGKILKRRCLLCVYIHIYLMLCDNLLFHILRLLVLLVLSFSWLLQNFKNANL